MNSFMKAVGEWLEDQGYGEVTHCTISLNWEEGRMLVHTSQVVTEEAADLLRVELKDFELRRLPRVGK